MKYLKLFEHTTNYYEVTNLTTSEILTITRDKINELLNIGIVEWEPDFETFTINNKDSHLISVENKKDIKSIKT